MLLTKKLVLIFILEKSENTLSIDILISEFYQFEREFFKMALAIGKKFPLVLAPTGMVPTKSMSPHVPITPEEIVSDVKACYDVGITSVHLHAREKGGAPTWEKRYTQR